MPRVLVAGRIDIDAVINVRRHPRPGEEVGGWNLQYLPGGKGANQAVAAARAGAEVKLFGCVGDDSFGQDIVAFLNEEKIDTSDVLPAPDFRTGIAFIVVDDDGQNTIVYDGASMPPFVFDEPELVSAGDIAVSQFDIPEPAILEFLRAGRRHGARTLFNAAPAQTISAELLSLVDVLVMNEFELAHALGQTIDPTDRNAVEAAVRAFRRPDGQALIATLGPHGAALAADHRVAWVEAPDVTPLDTTGAGDAFVGALAADLCRGVPLEEATRYACTSASVSVTRRGASVAMPYRHEVSVMPR